MTRYAWPLLGLACALPWAAAPFASPVREHPLAFLALFALPAAAWLAAALLVTRPATRVPALRLVLAAGVAARVLALPAAPSDDVARYLWEARVVRAGYDPYVLPPDAPEFSPLRAESPPGPVNHPGWTAIYPPLAQLWNALFGWNVLTLKLSYLLAEGLTLLCVLRLLALHGLPAARALVYWWCPLPVYATALEGHLDAVAGLLLVAALTLLLSRRDLRGGAALAAAALVKPFAVAVAPAFLRRVRPGTWVVLAAVAALGALPFASSGSSLFTSLFRFGSEMRTGDTLHAIVASAVAAAGVTSPVVSRLVVAGAWIALAALVALRGRPTGVSGALFLLGALLLFLPTLHPWYLALVVPLLAVVPWRGWLALSVTIVLPLAAHVEMLETGQWTEWRPLVWLAHAPLHAWLLTCAWRRGARLLSRGGDGVLLRARDSGSLT